jgi:hypothetical protein
MRKEETRPFGREGRPAADENPVDKLRAMQQRLAIRTSQARRKAMIPAPPKPEQAPAPEVEAPAPEPAETPAAPKASKSRWK